MIQQEKHTLMHMTVKILKNKDREKKNPKGHKKHCTKGDADHFWTEVMEARGQ